MLFAPSAQRNFAPILSVLEDVLPNEGRVLEIACGTGQHIAGFAENFPAIEWIPNDIDPQARRSIAARKAEQGLANLAAPLSLDVTHNGWFEDIVPPLGAILAINLIHIAPWQACLGVLDGAGALLAEDGMVFFYGCFSRGGEHLSPSNADFDHSLKRRNPQWGVRDTDDVAAAARARGLELAQIIDMPANNLALVLRPAG
ncbi:MAG: DUF938 domain-containing protein [Rhizobiales bacterium]|nr:DUF938 domain-containing protein [Hyphomicrobiales bacterium]